MMPQIGVRTGVPALAIVLSACAAPVPPGTVLMASPARAAQASYYVYVGAESADLLHRIRFTPGRGAVVEKTIPVGRRQAETDGPHGLRIGPHGRYLYMTTGHGVPDGKLWKYELGSDTLVAPEIGLGWFPATLDLTPDGLFAFVVNFNLHGDPVPSSVSVVDTRTMVEVARPTTCVMPHGSRVAAPGTRQYSACMMDDQVVEIDTRTFEVARRFSVALDDPHPIDAATWEPRRHGLADAPPTCKPTWAQPSVDGGKVYAACNGAAWILELDVGDWTVSRRFATAAPGPYNLDASPDGRLLVATLKPAAMIEVFDLATGESLGTAATSTTIAHGVAISSDSRYAFVSVEGVGAEPGKVDVFDLATVERVADVEVGQQAGGIAFWRIR